MMVALYATRRLEAGFLHAAMFDTITRRPSSVTGTVRVEALSN
jgi:hypothetical protein